MPLPVVGLVLVLSTIVYGAGGVTNATVIDPGLVGTCDNIEPTEEINVTRQDVEMYGNCVPYVSSHGDGGPCDTEFEAGVDYVYIPHTRLNGNITELNRILEAFKFFADLLTGICRTVVLRGMCFYLYPPCGNSTHFVPPPALCYDDCVAAQTEVCPNEYAALQNYIDNSAVIDLEAIGLNIVNCSDPGEFVNPLPHCCYTACIDQGCRNSTAGPTPTPTNITVPTDDASDSNGSSDTTVIAAVVASVGAVLAITLCVVVTVVLFLALKRRRKYRLKSVNPMEQELQVTGARHMLSERQPSERYFDLHHDGATGGATASPEDLELLKMNSMAIPRDTIELMDTIGKGEFGIVYRARLTAKLGKMGSGEIVAVKTLKGSMFGPGDFDAMIQEAIKMRDFEHPNVLGLIGVSIDVGESPYIVMPFMANGSLFSYLKKERANLTIAEGASEDLIEEPQTRLLSMCLQIARGMEYLAERRFVHRDLAARNCMIDANFVIKVADFGLSEDVYLRNYFRQGEKEGVKLPVKWMAMESLHDGIFTEKTDVWSFGVTCWEVFSLGKSPYPGVDPFTLITYLDGGERLGKPYNAACSTELYETLLQCWRKDPEERPSFKDLVQSLSTMLEQIAGYMDLSILSHHRHTSVSGGDYVIASLGEGESVPIITETAEQ